MASLRICVRTVRDHHMRHHQVCDHQPHCDSDSGWADVRVSSRKL